LRGSSTWLRQQQKGARVRTKPLPNLEGGADAGLSLPPLPGDAGEECVDNAKQMVFADATAAGCDASTRYV